MDPMSGLSQGQAAAPRVVNMLSVAAPQQVMLEVKIAEVSKTLVDQLGASVGLNGSRGSWTYTMLSNLLSGNPASSTPSTTRAASSSRWTRKRTMA
jgi:pilus assembly protein CpaC